MKKKKMQAIESESMEKQSARKEISQVFRLKGACERTAANRHPHTDARTHTHTKLYE